MALLGRLQSSGAKMDGLKNMSGLVNKGLLDRKNIAGMPIAASGIYWWAGFVLFMFSASAFNPGNPFLPVLFVAAAHPALLSGYRIVTGWAKKKIVW